MIWRDINPRPAALQIAAAGKYNPVVSVKKQFIDRARIRLIPENIFGFEGAKLNYRIAGQGKPVILLHGSMAADIWDGFADRLGKDFRVYMPELPGFGASEAVEGSIHNTDLFAEALGVFAEQTGLQAVPVVAFSLGTAVAIKAAAAGKLTGKLILVGMPVRLESRLLQDLMRLPVAARRKLAGNEVTRGGVLLSILKEVIGTSDSHFVLKYLRLLRTTDIRAMVDTDYTTEVEKEMPWFLSRVKNPLIFVYGERDRLRTGAEKFLGRPIELIAGAGHNVFVSRPEQTLIWLKRRLSEPVGWWQGIWQWLQQPVG